MKHNPHTIQIIRIAHSIITNMNMLIQSFHNNHETWTGSVKLLKYEADNMNTHLALHLALVEALKEGEE